MLCFNPIPFSGACTLLPPRCSHQVPRSPLCRDSPVPSRCGAGPRVLWGGSRTPQHPPCTPAARSCWLSTPDGSWGRAVSWGNASTGLTAPLRALLCAFPL